MLCGVYTKRAGNVWQPDDWSHSLGVLGACLGRAVVWTTKHTNDCLLSQLYYPSQRFRWRRMKWTVEGKEWNVHQRQQLPFWEMTFYRTAQKLPVKTSTVAGNFPFLSAWSLTACSLPSPRTDDSLPEFREHLRPKFGIWSKKLRLQGNTPENLLSHRIEWLNLTSWPRSTAIICFCRP